MAMQRRARPQLRIKFAVSLACAIVVVIAVVASATHLLHLPDVLPNAHKAAGMSRIDSMDPSLVGLRGTEVSSEHPYCSVEGLLPPSATALPLSGAFCAPSRLQLEQSEAWVYALRPQPPPMLGARLRATLQVYRN